MITGVAISSEITGCSFQLCKYISHYHLLVGFDCSNTLLYIIIGHEGEGKFFCLLLFPAMWYPVLHNNYICGVPFVKL